MINQQKNFDVEFKEPQDSTGKPQTNDLEPGSNLSLKEKSNDFVRVEFQQITTEEYDEIKKEIIQRFKFASVKRNNQNYALGGFSLNPRDYENGFSPEQIEKLCIFLKSLNIDDESLTIQSEEVYSEDKGNFAGTKIKYLILKNGFSFLMRIGNIIKNDKF